MGRDKLIQQQKMQKMHKLCILEGLTQSFSMYLKLDQG